QGEVAAGATPATEAERRARDRADISAALILSKGRVFGAGGAAELLGVKPTTLASRIKVHGLTGVGRSGGGA
ncbi:histidine kinase, partial [Methylobacterium sp. WL19]